MIDYILLHRLLNILMLNYISCTVYTYQSDAIKTMSLKDSVLHSLLIQYKTLKTLFSVIIVRFLTLQVQALLHRRHSWTVMCNGTI